MISVSENFVANYLQEMTACVDRIGARAVPAGYFYPTIEHFVLANGRQFKPARLNTALHRFGKPRQCFANTYHLVQWHGDAYTYVEGFAAMSFGIATPHAWAINTATGAVVDPTWRWQEDCQPASYFGVPLDFSLVLATAARRKRYGVLYNPEMDYPLMRQPFDATTTAALEVTQ